MNNIDKHALRVVEPVESTEGMIVNWFEPEPDGSAKARCAVMPINNHGM